MKHLFLSIFMVTLFTNLSQAQLNDYKYIIVPKKFEGFKKENQYLTSTYIKHLFTRKGFKTVYSDDLPVDLYGKPCSGLTVQFNDGSSMFTTKVVLALKDCNGQEIFETLEGRSKEKEFKRAYQQAIAKAFESIDTLPYSYSGKDEEPEPVTASFKNDVKTLKEEKPGPEKRPDPVIKQEATQETQSFKSLEPATSDYTKGAAQAQKEVQEETSAEAVGPETKEPIPSDVGKTGDKTSGVMGDDVDKGQVLYAQKIANGYQLVDSTPKIVLKIFETSVPNVYTANLEKGNGVVYQKDGKWFFEYYVEDKLTVKEMNIKF